MAKGSLKGSHTNERQQKHSVVSWRNTNYALGKIEHAQCSVVFAPILGVRVFMVRSMPRPREPTTA